jgi:Protein of unknown function (DUF3987)
MGGGIRVRRVLGAIERKDNTLSAVLRELWDRGEARTLAKNAHEQTTGALLSVIGHVTPQELRARLSSTEMANGFANRFLFVCSRRSKLCPEGGSLPDEAVRRLAKPISDALELARKITRVDLDDDARELWRTHYERLTTPPPGLLGAVLGRAAPIVLRLALVCAALDGRPFILREHLSAALAVWTYAEASARFVFGQRLGDPLADKLHAALLEAGPQGVFRADLHRRHAKTVPTDRLGAALGVLRTAELAWSIAEETAGRTAERWIATACHSPKTSPQEGLPKASTTDGEGP